MSRRAPAARGKRDANHAQIADLYVKLGCGVQDTSIVGDSFGDMVVSLPHVNDVVEIKTEDGDLSKGQIEFNRTWPGTIVTVRTDEEVIAHVADMRRRSNHTADLYPP